MSSQAWRNAVYSGRSRTTVGDMLSRRISTFDRARQIAAFSLQSTHTKEQLGCLTKARQLGKPLTRHKVSDRRLHHNKYWWHLSLARDTRSRQAGQIRRRAHPVGDSRPDRSPLPPPLLLLLLPVLAAGAGLLSAAGAERDDDDEPDDITAPMPKTSRGFFTSSEPARLVVRDAVPAPAGSISFRAKRVRSSIYFRVCQGRLRVARGLRIATCHTNDPAPAPFLFV